MDYDVGESDQYPVVGSRTFPVQALVTRLQQLLLDVIDDGAQLRLVIGRTDNEDVGERQMRADIDGDDIRG